MLLLQPLIKTLSFLGIDKPDSNLAKKLWFGRDRLLCHVSGFAYGGFKKAGLISNGGTEGR